MGRRCLVLKCTSKSEANKFSAAFSKHGHAYCPVHFLDSSRCKCTATTKLFSEYVFPKSPGLRRLWNVLLKLGENYNSKNHEIVCSKHFDLTTKGLHASRQKVPILHIGRPDSEIQQILNAHVSSVIEQQMVIGLSSPPSTIVNAHLANATASAIFSLETTENIRKPRAVGGDENILEGFGDAFDNLEESAGYSGRVAASATASVESSVPLGEMNIAMESDEPIIMRRWRPPQPITDPTRTPPPRLRPVSMVEPTTEQSPPSHRRRPVSAVISPQETPPPPAEKRRCSQETPNYGAPAGALCMSCVQKDSEVAILKAQLQTIQMELGQSKVVIFNLQSRETVRWRTLRAANIRLNKRLEKMKRVQVTVVKTKTEVDLDIDAMPDERFRVLFGVRKKIFKLLFEKLEPIARTATYWKGDAATTEKKRATTPKQKSQQVYMNEMLCFLMRLRHKPNIELLCLIFNWSAGWISEIVNTWLDIFSRQLDWMARLPDPLTSRLVLPSQIAGMYPRLRCIIDCTELFVQSPQGTADQAAVYSHYKKHTSYKALIGILGNGLIAFISETWAGRTSDNYIFKHCGLLELLQNGDQLLADKGFRINDELLRRGIEINIPPGTTGVPQFPGDRVFEGQRIAHVRIHVERAIGRMKTYQIMQGVLPLTMTPFVDKIFKCVAILVNLQDELVHSNV